MKNSFSFLVSFGCGHMDALQLYTVVSSILRATVCIKYSQFMRLHRVQVSSCDKLCSRRGRISNNSEKHQQFNHCRSIPIYGRKMRHRRTPHPLTHLNQSIVRDQRKKNNKEWRYLFMECVGIRDALRHQRPLILSVFPIFSASSSSSGYASIVCETSIPACNENSFLLWHTASQRPKWAIKFRLSNFLFVCFAFLFSFITARQIHIMCDLCCVCWVHLQKNDRAKREMKNKPKE